MTTNQHEQEIWKLLADQFQGYAEKAELVKEYSNSHAKKAAVERPVK